MLVIVVNVEMLYSVMELWTSCYCEREERERERVSSYIIFIVYWKTIS